MIRKTILAAAASAILFGSIGAASAGGYGGAPYSTPTYTAPVYSAPATTYTAPAAYTAPAYVAPAYVAPAYVAPAAYVAPVPVYTPVYKEVCEAVYKTISVYDPYTYAYISKQVFDHNECHQVQVY